MKFIVQPYGAIIHDPGRMPTSLGSGASVGAATGVPSAASTCASSAGVNQDGRAPARGIAQPSSYGRVPGEDRRSTWAAAAPTGAWSSAAAADLTPAGRSI